jgi:LmbE family N-acetylglucosaminyl deacetylase
MLDILVIAPHPDDAELGMAGAILKFKAEGAKVGVLDLTSGEPTPFGSLEKRAAETAAASEILGLDWRQNLGLPNRSLEPTLDARRELAIVFRQTRPKWLFAPYWIDAHPDHVAATQLVEAARFWSKLSKTEMPGEPWHPRRIFNYYCVHLKQAAQPLFSQPVHRRPAHGTANVSRRPARRSGLLGQGDRHCVWRAVSFSRANRNEHAAGTHLVAISTGRAFNLKRLGRVCR